MGAITHTKKKKILDYKENNALEIPFLGYPLVKRNYMTKKGELFLVEDFFLV